MQGRRKAARSRTSGGLVKVSITISPGLLEQLDEQGTERNLSRSAVIVDHIRKSMRAERNGKGGMEREEISV